jgi:hypothetical protein
MNDFNLKSVYCSREAVGYGNGAAVLDRIRAGFPALSDPVA